MKRFPVFWLVLVWIALASQSVHAQTDSQAAQSHALEAWKKKIIQHIVNHTRRSKSEINKAYGAIAPMSANGNEVILLMEVSASGRIVSSRVERSSGYPALDEAALRVLQRANPLPRPPGGAGDTAFLLPFLFDTGPGFSVKRAAPGT